MNWKSKNENIRNWNKPRNNKKGIKTGFRIKKRIEPDLVCTAYSCQYSSTVELRVTLVDHYLNSVLIKVDVNIKYDNHLITWWLILYYA